MTRDLPGERPEQPDELARLPHGRHGLPPEFVAHNQSQRLIASLVRTVADQGYNATTITNVVEGAGVTTRTFYKYFESVEDCYLAAFDTAVDLIGRRLAEAYASEDDWPLKLRASISALLGVFASSPELARLCLTEPFVAGARISRRYQEQVDRLASYLREGRNFSSDAASYPETTERGLIGSIASQVGRKVSAGEAEQLPELLPDLVQFALTPYLGAVEARRVALSSAS